MKRMMLFMFAFLTLLILLPGDFARAGEAWRIPRSVDASIGLKYWFVTPIGGDRRGIKVTAVSSNPFVATVDSEGALTAKNLGTTMITVRDEHGVVKTGKVTVVKNRYECSRPLMLKRTCGLYASTHRMHYVGGALKIEIFLYNYGLQEVTGLKEKTKFELYQDGQAIMTQEIRPMTFLQPIKSGEYVKLTVLLADGQWERISGRMPDLCTRRYYATVSGTSRQGTKITSLDPDLDGAVKAPLEECVSVGVAPMLFTAEYRK